jgi:hypothetical protein
LAILRRPVAERAALSAIITASEPVLRNRTRSNRSTRSHSSSASRTSLSVGMAKHEPRRSRASAAATIAGWAWPWISEAKLLVRSNRRTPSTSVT